VHEQKEFKGLKLAHEEIIEIINKDRINDETSQVQYSLINFLEMIKKI